MCKIFYMRKDQSATSSRTRLITAVTELLDAGADSDRVTVTDIVTAAGLTRPTFYASFDDLPTAYAAAALARLDAAFVGLGVDPEVAAESRSERMRVAFESILDRLVVHADFFARVMRGPGGPIVHERIVDFLAARIRESSPVSHALARGPLPLEMSSTAIAGGVVWTMKRWMDEDARLAVANLAVLLRDYVEASVFGGLGRPLEVHGNDKQTLDMNGAQS